MVYVSKVYVPIFFERGVCLLTTTALIREPHYYIISLSLYSTINSCLITHDVKRTDSYLVPEMNYDYLYT